MPPLLPLLGVVIVGVVAVTMGGRLGERHAAGTATLTVMPVTAVPSGLPRPADAAAGAALLPPPTSTPSPSPSSMASATGAAPEAGSGCDRTMVGGMLNPACAALRERTATPGPSPTPGATASGRATPQPLPSDATQVVEWACNDPLRLMGSVNPLCMLKKVNEGLSTWLAEMAVWLASKIGEALSATGDLDLTAEWFTGVYSGVSSIAALIALIAVLVSVIAAALFRDVGEIWRTLLKVLTAGVSTGMVVVIVSKADELIEAFCALLLGPAGWKEITDGLMVPATKLDEWLGMAAPLAPTGVMLLISIGIILAFLVLWVEMLVRRLLLDVCVMMWPLIVSGAVWTGARPTTRRLIDTIISLLIMEPVVVAILKMANKMLLSIDSLDDMVLALVLYWLAAFSPWMLMRLIGIVGGLNPGGTSEGIRGAVVGAAGAMLARGRRLASGGLGNPAALMRGGGRTPMPDIAGAGAPAGGGEEAGGGEQGDGERDYSKIRPIPAHLLRAVGIQPAPGAWTGSGPRPGSGAEPESGAKQPAGNGKDGPPASGSRVKSGPPPAASPATASAAGPASGSTPSTPSAPARSAPTAPGSAPGPAPAASGDGSAPPSRVRGTSGGRLPPPLMPPSQHDRLPTYDDVPPPPPVPLPPPPQPFHQPELPHPDPPPEPS